MSDPASSMPARIWAGVATDGVRWCKQPTHDGTHPYNTLFIRADIVERMAEALRECQSALSSLTAPKAIETTTVATAWANCVAAEAKARTALTSYREASNVES